MRRLTDEELEEAWGHFENGISLTALGRVYGTSRKALAARWRDQGKWVGITRLRASRIKLNTRRLAPKLCPTLRISEVVYAVLLLAEDKGISPTEIHNRFVKAMEERNAKYPPKSYKGGLVRRMDGDQHQRNQGPQPLPDVPLESVEGGEEGS